MGIDSDLEYEIEYLLKRVNANGAELFQTGSGGNFNTPGGTPSEGQGILGAGGRFHRMAVVHKGQSDRLQNHGFVVDYQNAFG